MNEYENPILTLIVQVGLILALSRIMGLLFARFRQPQVIGEMVAGIMLGPSLLGWLAPPVYETLFPRDSVAVLSIVSQIGVVFFLFLVGLEFDPELVRRRGKSAAVISASSIAVPFVTGVAMTYFLYPRLFDQPRTLEPTATEQHFWASALFMGAAISVTAFPVLARILTERNLHKTHVGAVSLTCAAVNDVLAWCLLALVVGVAQYDPRRGPTDALWTIAGAAGFIAFMLLAMRPFLRRIQALYDRQGRLSQNLVAVIILLILGSAYATERIGIHALFGAFLIGFVMPKGSKFVRELSEKLEDFTIVFLLPVFFAYAGLSTDLTPRNFSPDLWGYTLLIILLACAGKIGGTAVSARLCGHGWRESTAVGVLMNTRGLMELIILTIGLSLGVINQSVFTMMVIMALVTTGMTAPLLAWVYPARLFGGDEASAKLARERARVGAPAFSVLVPVAMPESGAALARLAATLVDRRAGGKLIALHLRRPVDHEAFRSGLGDVDSLDDPALAPLMEEAKHQKLPADPISFVTRDVAADIASVAAAHRVGLVVMGFHKPVFSTTILGGTVHRVLTQCETDVAVFVDRGFAAVRRVLVPYLGSAHDRLAMELGARIARNTGAEVTILHVVPPAREGRTLDAKGALERSFAEPALAKKVALRIVKDRSPVTVVLREAREFDLVILGVSEEWGLESHLFGWRPQRIARECPTSMIIVRKYHPAPVAEPAVAPEQPHQHLSPATQDHTTNCG